MKAFGRLVPRGRQLFEVLEVEFAPMGSDYLGNYGLILAGKTSQIGIFDDIGTVLMIMVMGNVFDRFRAAQQPNP